MFNHNSEERIKRLEEEIAWLHKDMSNLINMLEAIHPEIHYHLYYDMRTCTDDPNNTDDLDKLT